MSLALRDLEVSAGARRLLGPLDLELRPGHCLGVVGESGSGKSLTALSMLGLLPANLHVRGMLALDGDDRPAGVNHHRDGDSDTRPPRDKPPHASIALGAPVARSHAALRGCVLAWVPQDPLASLHPLRRIGAQLRETLRTHGQADGHMQALLERVRVPEPAAALRRYPHEFSGGQRQRIAIALALASRPRYLIADEPTSALDARIAREILDLLDGLRREDGLGVMLISHDLPLVGAYADDVLVLRRGAVVERGKTAAVFAAPTHEYTRELLEADRLPSALVAAPEGATHPSATHSEHTETAVAPSGAPTTASSETAAPLLRAEAMRMRYPRASRPALDDVSLTLQRGEGLALLGESGSGKSTLGRALLRLLRGAQGRVWLDGVELTALRGADLRAMRKRIGVVFQDPYASLDPRMRIAEIISEPLRIHRIGDAAMRARTARSLLSAVGLDPAMAERYPHQASGGQRQRIAIARALACEPELLVCDEAVSALDAHHRAGVLRLLSQLKRERGLALIFVTHDIAAAAAVAERIAVLEAGRIVEIGATSDVLTRPQHAHTQALLAARRLSRS
jgi:ABC-type glutathione transport system ATPase component